MAYRRFALSRVSEIQRALWHIAAFGGLLALTSLSTIGCAGSPSSHPGRPSAGSTAGASQRVTAFRAVSSSIIWLETQTTISRSTDAGAHWTKMLSGRGVLGPAALLDGDHAWVASTGSNQPVAIWRTADGGRTWQVVRPVTDTSGVSLQLTFADSEHGWILQSTGAAAGSQGARLLASSNGGETWAEVSRGGGGSGAGTIPFPCQKVGVTFVTAVDGFLAGECAGSQPAFLYRTQDGGRTWQLKPLTAPAGWPTPNLTGDLVVQPPRFFDAAHGVLPVRGSGTGVGAGRLLIYVTADDGKSWTPVSSPPGSPVGFAAVSMTTWLAADEAGLDRTVDGGRSWSSLRPVPSLHRVIDLQFTDPTVGWALQETDGGTGLLKTRDGGRTWTQVVTA